MAWAAIGGDRERGAGAKGRRRPPGAVSHGIWFTGTPGSDGGEEDRDADGMSPCNNAVANQPKYICRISTSALPNVVDRLCCSTDGFRCPTRVTGI